MAKPCRLKVTMPYESPYPREEIYDLEQAKHLVFGRGPGIIVVEEQMVNSYEELEKIALDRCEEGKLVNVLLLPLFDGG